MAGFCSKTMENFLLTGQGGRNLGRFSQLSAERPIHTFFATSGLFFHLRVTS